MSISYSTFERLKERGLAAYKAGNFAEAKPFLMQAADVMIKIAADGSGARRASAWRTNNEEATL